MTKKIFAMFLAVLMVLSVLPISTMAAEATCPGKGKHTADNCTRTVVQTVKPACGSNGYTTYKCSVCGEEFVDSFVQATGEHDYVADAETAVEPTCGAYGYEAGYKCSICGDVKKGAPIDPVHELGIACEYKPVNAAVDCLTGGKQIFKCVNCGHTYEKKIDKKNAHNWDVPEIVKEATATVPGEIKLTCKDCGKVTVAELYGAHTHKWEHVAAKTVNPCTEDTWLEHYECRVCGAWSQKDVVSEDEVIYNVIDENYKIREEWLVKAGHTLSYTCLDTVAECSVCHEKVDVSGNTKHAMVDKTPGVNTTPTCTQDVYKVEECSRCGYRKVTTKPALGHDLRTVTVPATCGQYAYSFTYCVRPSCSTKEAISASKVMKNGNIDVTFDVTVPNAQFKAVDKVKADTAYKFVFAHGTLGKLGFNGTMSATGSMSVSVTYEENVDVYFEEILNNVNRPYKDNNHRLLYIVKNGEKLYFSVSEVWNSYAKEYELNYAFTADKKLAQVVTVSNDGLVSFTVKGYIFDGNEGTYTFGAANNTGDMAFGIVKGTAAVPARLMSFDKMVATNVRVITLSPDFKGGFDANNHEMVTVTNDATCQQVGNKITYCKNGHGTVTNETLPIGDHKWLKPGDADYKVPTEEQMQGNDFAKDTKKGKNDGMLEATCTVAGFVYKYCAYCGTYERETVDAIGHQFNYDELLEVKADHTKDGYTYYLCENDGCDYELIQEYKVWPYKSNIFYSLDEAKKAHGITGDLIPTSVSPETCTVDGIAKYKCTGKGCKYSEFTVITPAHHNYGNKTVDVPAFVSNDTTDKSFASSVEVTKGSKYEFQESPLELKKDKEYIFGEIEESNLGLFTEKNGVYTLVKGVSVSNNSIFSVSEDGNYYVLNKAWVQNDGKLIKKNVKSVVSGKFHEYVEGTDVNHETVYKAPNCTIDGWLWGYVCIAKDCGQVVGTMNVKTILPKTGHNYVMTSTNANYQGTCENPGLIGEETCVNCDDTRKVYDYEKSWDVAVNADDPCTGYSYTLYTCKICGKDHVRNFQGLNGHKYVFVEANWDAKLEERANNTCYSQAYAKYKCAFCNYEIPVPMEAVPHVNAAGEKFFNSCTDKVTDRHCVVCHAQNNSCATSSMHDCATYVGKNGETCGCVIGKDHNYGAVSTMKPSTCTMAPYTLTVCDDCGETEMSIAINPETKRPYGASGHKPAQAEYKLDANGNKIIDINDEDKDGNTTEEVILRKAGYVYPKITWTYVSINKTTGKFEQHSETYIAEMTAYQAASYTEAGFGHFYCTVCKANVEQTYAKKTGVGFELVAGNANGSQEVAVGSLLALTLNLNANNIGVNGFSANVKFDGAVMKFIGVEMGEDFYVTAQKKDNENVVIVNGFGANTINGKPANTVINGETAVATLLFRVTDSCAEAEFELENTEALDKDYNRTLNTGVYNNQDNNVNDSIKIRDLLDLDGNGAVQMNDIYLAMDIIAGAIENRTYDATVDMDKNGELTLQDMIYAYEFYTARQANPLKAAQEAFLRGIEGAERTMWETELGLRNHVCRNPFCTYASANPFDYCPKCGLKQTN